MSFSNQVSVSLTSGRTVCLNVAAGSVNVMVVACSMSDFGLMVLLLLSGCINFIVFYLFLVIIWICVCV